MDCTVLGAGGMMPMPARFTTSVMLRKDGRMLLFDGGEGIQIPLKKCGLGIKAVDIIAISHLHADHVLGIPGLLMFRAQCDDPGELTIVGPVGIKRFIENTINDLHYHLNFPIKYIEWSKENRSLEWNGGTLYWEPLKHSTFCLGYRYVENERPGKFDLSKAREQNIPPGPMFGQLQNGQTITLENGQTIEPSQVLGDKRKGRIISYATDTMPCSGLENIIKDADLAFVEGMFTLFHETEAHEKRHSTAAASAKQAYEQNTKKLVLIHISPRYTFEDEKILTKEAQDFFKNSSVARGLNTYEIPLPD